MKTKKYTASIQYGMKFILDNKNKIVLRDDSLSVDELIELAERMNRTS